jgi:hypothetical protein
MRCKACDEVLDEQEIIWVPGRNQHEELCKSCRWLDRKDTIMYPEDTEVEYYNHVWRAERQQY